MQDIKATVTLPISSGHAFIIQTYTVSQSQDYCYAWSWILFQNKGKRYVE